MRNRLVGDQIAAAMGWNGDQVKHTVLGSPTGQLFRQMLFARVAAPNLKRLGASASSSSRTPIGRHRTASGPGLKRGRATSRAGASGCGRRPCLGTPRMRQRPRTTAAAVLLETHREGREVRQVERQAAGSDRVASCFRTVLQGGMCLGPHDERPLLRARAGATPASRDDGAGAIGACPGAIAQAGRPTAPSWAVDTPRSLKRAVPASMALGSPRVNWERKVHATSASLKSGFR